MDFDLDGYLRTEPLAVSKPLMPLFEAVVNAIDAVEDSPTRRVQIQIVRDTAQTNSARLYGEQIRSLDSGSSTTGSDSHLPTSSPLIRHFLNTKRRAAAKASGASVGSRRSMR